MRHRSAQATYPDPTRATPLGPYLVLLQVGFAVPVCCQTRGALLPHHFTLATRPARLSADWTTWPDFRPASDPWNRSAVSFCCTFRRLAPPRHYLAPCPVEPGLSSAPLRVTRLSGRLRRGHCRTRGRTEAERPFTVGNGHLPDNLLCHEAARNYFCLDCLRLPRVGVGARTNANDIK